MMTAAEQNTSRELLFERLREAANAQSMLEVANFQFIGLDDIRAAYGDRWPARRHKILQCALTFLTRRVDKKDILIPGATGFVIVYVEATLEESQKRSQLLSKALNAFILGELKDPLGPSTEVETVSVHVDTMIHSMGGASGEKKKTAAAKSGSERNSSALNCHFQPVWNVKRESITGFDVIPYIRTVQKVVPGYLCDPTTYSTGFYENIDLASLKRSEEALKKLEQEGRRALIGVPLHVQTLSNTEARGKMVRMLSSFDKRLARCRIVKIASVPAGFPSLYIEEIVRYLRPYAPNISISLSSDETEIRSFTNLELYGLGIAISEANSTMPARPLLERMKQFANVLSHSRTTSFVEGCFGPKLAMRFCAQGTDYLSSPWIWPMCENAHGASAWPADNLIVHESQPSVDDVVEI